MAQGDPSHYSLPGIDLLAPDLKRIVDESLFDQVWNRPGLSFQHRCMSTISALMTLGQLPLLRRQVERSLNLGLTPEQILEVFVHLILYGGYINSRTAMRVARSMFTEQGLTV